MDHLQLHHGSWRVRLRVPAAVIDVVGQRVLTRTTGTADYDRAVRLSAPILKEFRRIIDRATGKKPGRIHVRHVVDRTTRSCEWYTPPRIFEALGVEFDMDVASPGAATVPWIPARGHVTENSLEREWRGMVWLNPPFGLRFGIQDWIEKFVAHGNGILLLPSNSYCRWWQHVSHRVDAILHVKGYVNHSNPNGRKTQASYGTCLLAIGPQAVSALKQASANGLGHVFQPDREQATSNNNRY